MALTVRVSSSKALTLHLTVLFIVLAFFIELAIRGCEGFRVYMLADGIFMPVQ